MVLKRMRPLGIVIALAVLVCVPRLASAQRPPRAERARKSAQDRPHDASRRSRRTLPANERRRDAAQRDRRGDKPANDRDANRSRRHGGRRGPRDVWSGRFGPSEADRGPLSQEEEAELLEFARQHMPRWHRALRDAQGRNPRLFRKKVNEFAPRIRFIRRLHAKNPELAKKFVRRVETEHRLRRMRFAFAKSNDEQRRRLIIRAARPLVTRMIDTGLEIMGMRLEALRESRDADVESELARLSAPDADLVGDPPFLRELIADLREADGDQRTELEHELRDKTADHIDDRINGFARRLEERRTRREQATDRRMRELFRPRRDRAP